MIVYVQTTVFHMNKAHLFTCYMSGYSLHLLFYSNTDQFKNTQSVENAHRILLSLQILAILTFLKVNSLFY